MQILAAENLSYIYPGGREVFTDVSFSFHEGEKAALVGDNGSGKSTLLRILSGAMPPDQGRVYRPDHMWMVPQHLGQYDDRTIAEALQIDRKVEALRFIEDGSVDPSHFDAIAGDWDVHERTRAALKAWGLPAHSLNLAMGALSGGQKTRVFLAGMQIHDPDLVLMDEPTNHLDASGRERVCDAVRNASREFLVVSHDRTLLDVCAPIYELSALGIEKYGGGYAFYEEQKRTEKEALRQQIHHTKQSISEAKSTKQEVAERKQRRDARGKKKARGEGLPKVLQRRNRNRAQSSASWLSDTHGEKISEERERLRALKDRQRRLQTIKVALGNSSVRAGKVLYEGEGVNYVWEGEDALWEKPLSFAIRSGERVRIAGANGSGKSTLIQLLSKNIAPTEGQLEIRSEDRILMDQDYKIIDRDATVAGQALASSDPETTEGEAKTLLHRYLFGPATWEQSCASLSGGEMMRLSLCCLSLRSAAPDTIILDEPTNNIDLRNLKILQQSLLEYEGTLIVVSHDEQFVENVELNRTLDLPAT